MRYAVVLTHNRPNELEDCIGALLPQVNHILVVDNASDPPVSLRWPNVDLTYVREQPPNLAKFMNVGFDWAESCATSRQYRHYDVAVVCDDVTVPENWFEHVVACLRHNGSVAGSTHTVRSVDTPLVQTTPNADIYNRMQGSAFVVVGEVGLRADENMHWWWQDTDLDWQARQAGGTVIAPGPVAHNRYPNYFTATRPELAIRIGADAAAFRAKWGWQPW